jgi:hypothetical protein
VARESGPVGRFNAVIRLHAPNPCVDVPANVSTEFAPWARAGRIRVAGLLNSIAISGTLMPVRGGGHRLYVNGAIRAAAGVAVGDEVTLALRPVAPDEVTIPPDVADAFEAAGASSVFESLAPSHRREWLRHIDDARSPRSRTRRIVTAVGAVTGAPSLRTVDHPARRRELWTCPECGSQFVNRNQYHSCSTHTVDEVFAGRPRWVRELFDEVRAMVEANGPVKIVAYKDRIAFMVRVRFAGATPRSGWLDVSMWLPERVASSRWHRIETISPIATVHVLRISAADQLDDEIRSWLALAYAVGCQDHLAKQSPAPRRPVDTSDS